MAPGLLSGTGLPATVTWPLAFTRPVTALTRVVLPDPLGPTRPSASPEEMWSDTESTATTPPNRTVMSLHSRRVGVVVVVGVAVVMAVVAFAGEARAWLEGPGEATRARPAGPGSR